MVKILKKHHNYDNVLERRHENSMFLDQIANFDVVSNLKGNTQYIVINVISQALNQHINVAKACPYVINNHHSVKNRRVNEIKKAYWRLHLKSDPNELVIKHLVDKLVNIDTTTKFAKGKLLNRISILTEMISKNFSNSHDYTGSEKEIFEAFQTLTVLDNSRSRETINELRLKLDNFQI